MTQILKTKKKLSKPALILVIGIVIIAIPCLVFAGILGISWLQKGTPRNGSRFKDDLVVEISKSDVKDIEADLATLPNIDSVEVSCDQGQLKVFIDINDSLSETDVDSIMTQAYNKITAKLPIDTYFTKTDAARNYDLQINVYTSIEASEIGASNPRQYKLLHKNSSQESYQIDDLAKPKNEELARELEGLTIEDKTAEDDKVEE